MGDTERVQSYSNALQALGNTRPWLEGRGGGSTGREEHPPDPKKRTGPFTFPLVASLFLVAMPFAPSSFLLLVAMPGAPSSSTDMFPPTSTHQLPGIVFLRVRKKQSHPLKEGTVPLDTGWSILAHVCPLQLCGEQHLKYGQQ